MKFFILIACLFSLSAFGQEIGLERPAGAVDCNQSVKRCTYIVQNGTAAKLIQRIERILFPGTILTPSEGYIEAESLKEIGFWLESDELLERFKGLIPSLDTFESFDPTSLVQISIDVYGMTETGLTNLTASLQSVGPANDDSGDFSISTGNAALDLTLKLGTNLLASALGSKNVKKYTKKLTTVTRYIPNRAEINFSHTSNIYISPTAGSVKEEKVGLNIDGEVSIERIRNDLIKIQDFSFRYGVLIPGVDPASNRVNVLEVTNPEVYLLSGISNLIVSTTTDEVTRTRGWGLLSVERGKDENLSKLMVVVRAEPLSFESVIDRMRDMRVRDLHGTFTATDRTAMNPTGPDLKQILDTGIDAYARFTASGDRILGFNLDKKMASLATIDKNIEIEIKTRGMKQKAIRTVENLMISGIRFDELPRAAIDKELVKFTLKFKTFRGPTLLRKNLWYNPQTNAFISE
ncbi:MAG: hypothetical protein COW01_13620 [Bdellovibrionales bacterium CG12_big_fil_rev_8_21_14_0_65_38_15]|nr:MAG: hypothetical protein COW79_16440 [Bdellovibrionales bacterium CG22_combo_CG10-13_8_21_14_all_38_13]PIQ53312.1 MAG: hypothetical protein COW01_13620 [Bdellovibrionales bacterium CG12_big_fil_rev_8_21_14_0_65_38_15]PIR30326.1 MAG: hypothetical protein COV38_06140 [Bdellovibrionales bacterium CG11_big_fil_rev_8_21_14_0_20_38_13]